MEKLSGTAYDLRISENRKGLNLVPGDDHNTGSHSRKDQDSNREEAAQPIGSSGKFSKGSNVSRPRPTTSGGNLRQSLAASRRRLAEVAIEKENLQSRIGLLDLQRQNEELNIQEKLELLSGWEDNVSAVFPVNNQDATTNNN